MRFRVVRVIRGQVEERRGLSIGPFQTHPDSVSSDVAAYSRRFATRPLLPSLGGLRRTFVRRSGRSPEIPFDGRQVGIEVSEMVLEKSACSALRGPPIRAFRVVRGPHPPRSSKRIAVGVEWENDGEAETRPARTTGHSRSPRSQGIRGRDRAERRTRREGWQDTDPRWQGTAAPAHVGRAAHRKYLRRIDRSIAAPGEAPGASRRAPFQAQAGSVAARPRAFATTANSASSSNGLSR